MFEDVVAGLASLVRRARRIERRELAELRRWLENTNNLVHVSVLVFVPLLIGVVTHLTNALVELSFLLFPPLAAGTFTLFRDPEGAYSSPGRFVIGLTVGAVCGWAALSAAGVLYANPGDAVAGVHPGSAALSIFLTGLATWLLDVEEPSAFSTALLILVTDRASPAAYVLSVAVFSTLVAVVFAVWRDEFYERRAEYLYETVRGDDHVLVPMIGASAPHAATFGATLAAAHDAGKVVLLGVAGGADGDGAVADGAGDAADDGHADVAVREIRSVEDAPADLVRRLETEASAVRERFGVPCEVVVAEGDPVTATLRAARDANCDLVVTPYEADGDLPAGYVRGLFDSSFDVVAFRSTTGRESWRRVLVPVSRPGDSAHAMIEFATRLAGAAGRVSVCTCIGREVERRAAENTLANLVETVSAEVETRVARSEVVEFIHANAASYDLVVLGSSGDRSRASRLVSPPTFERVGDVDCDVAVVDRGTV
jgi:hypothetical protein